MSDVLASAKLPTSARCWSHTGVMPAMAAPARFPTAPTAKATRVAAAATSRPARALATMTRPRCGTRVKVVSPLRWLHSAVTDGGDDGQDDRDRHADCEGELAVGELLLGAQAMTAPLVSREAIPMLASSHNPERVSKDLRSSTPAMRLNGIPCTDEVGGCRSLAEPVR